MDALEPVSRPPRVAEHASTKRDQQREETRARLLAVSLELFTSKGYAGTTVRDITGAAGVSAGLFFHYFASKQAVLEEHVTMASSGVDAFLAALEQSDSPLETFRGVATAILESFARDDLKRLYLLANQVFSVETIPSSVKAAMRASQPIEASVRLITLGQERGELKAGDPLALSVTFWGAIQGVAEVLLWNPGLPIPSADHVLGVLAAH